MDTGVIEGGLNVTLTIRLLMHGKVLALPHFVCLRLKVGHSKCLGKLSCLIKLKYQFALAYSLLCNKSALFTPLEDIHNSAVCNKRLLNTS